MTHRTDFSEATPEEIAAEVFEALRRCVGGSCSTSVSATRSTGGTGEAVLACVPPCGCCGDCRSEI